MNIKKLTASLCVCMTLMVTAVSNAGEQLKVFILAGQSNMVGHARAHTIATLYASDSPRDKALLELVIKGDDISRDVLENQLEAAQTLDQLTGGISNSKVKDLEDGPEKTALEKKVEGLKSAHQAYKDRISSACVVSDRVYINSIADRNKKAGKLAIGCGADPSKIGPEYSFGLSIAEKVDETAVSLAQRAAAKSTDFHERVRSVESYLDYSNYSHSVFEKGWPEHFHEWDTVGSDRPYHYLGSGAFFVRLGDSFAKAMHECMAK